MGLIRDYVISASKEWFKGSEVTFLFTIESRIAPFLENDDVTVTAAMTSPERLLYWIMILKKNIKNFRGREDISSENFFFFLFSPVFTSSNVKCMKSITSSVIPAKLWVSSGANGLSEKNKTKQNNKKTLEFVVICLDYCLDFRVGEVGKQKHKKTRWLYFTAVWVVQTSSAPSPSHKMICFKFICLLKHIRTVLRDGVNCI